jgi:hypothetical protein
LSTEQTKRGDDSSILTKSPEVPMNRANNDLELSFKKIENVDLKKSIEFQEQVR